MADLPTDLGPFRSMVGFTAGAWVALVSMVVEQADRSQPNWIEFQEPAIGEFGLVREWELPAGEPDRTLVHGYHVVSGSVAVVEQDAEYPFVTLNLVNLARTLADHPVEEGADPRTHLVFDYLFEPFDEEDVGRVGYIRCEVYRGPPLADIVAHLDPNDVFMALGDSFDTARTAFQYRRDGVTGRVGAFEQAITVGAVQRRMRISIPLAGDDHTPIFELI